MTARDVFGIVGTTQAGNFHVERVVAEGGFGVVYRAQHGAFRAPVALKCLKIPEQMTKQQRSIFLEKFREEAELMFRLSAAITEVVRPLHVDVLLLPDGRFVPFLALEWLEGESLDGIITRRRAQGQAPLGLHKVVKMMRPIATALSKAHRFPGPQGAVSIVHRDLKPENIFVANIGGNESMKILDYGIAKAKRAASQAAGRITVRTLEEDETASFTPAYGAPEQWTPKTYGETGPWTDVWGLGLTIVEALCGSPPLDGDTYVMRRACLDEKRRPTPRALGADVPVEVEKVFEKALAVDPRRRFNDIESFWSELEVAMGLTPSLRPRDRRREEEPAAAAGAEGAAAAPAASAAGARLAKIELLRVPSVLDMPSVRLVPDPPVPPLAPLAAPASRPRAGPEKVGEIPGRAKAMLEAAGVTPRSDDEDWASLGLGDHPGGARPRPPAERPKPEPPPRQQPAPPPAPEPPKKPEPSARRITSELEMSLPIQDVPGASGDWEMSLPTSDAAPEPAGYAPAPAPVSAPVVAPPAASRRHSIDLELSLPSSDAAPEPASSRRSLSGELEVSLPTMATAEPPPSAAPTTPAARSVAAGEADAGFELGVVSSTRSSTAGPEPKAPPAAAPQEPMVKLAPALALRRSGETKAPLSVRERLLAPVGMLLGALVVAGIDTVFHKVTGNPLELGPVRPFWIAAPLALVGVGFLLWRLMGVHDDE